MLNPAVPEEGFSITINTTEDCNLRCKYCYEINKRARDIPLEYCKKFIDHILSDEDPCGFSQSESKDLNMGLYRKGLIMDFIGGDALMNVDLLDEIMTYTLTKLLISKSANARYWRNHLRFSVTSNGTLFSDPKVRAFCEKWTKYNLLSVTVSLDGCPEIHDRNRIMKQRGEQGQEIGSMSYILNNWDWYTKTFPVEDTRTTKSTLAKDSIPYMLESLKYLHEEMKLSQIDQNFIMEDAHLTDEDYIMFDKQMRECVEYVLVHKDSMYWSMLDENRFAKHLLSQGEEWTRKGHCGSGAMPCLGINGNIYPCFRWAPHTQSSFNPEPIVVGNIQEGFNNKDGFRKVREGSYRSTCTKDEKCRACIYESACAYCIGGCFAEYQDFVRTNHICEITKIQCKWAKVYWNEYARLKGLPLQFNAHWLLDTVRPWTRPMSTVDEFDY